MNNWTIIRDAAAYEKALKRIQEIFHAEPGSPEFDELELLAILVDEYESRHFHITTPEPLEIIHFVIEQRGLRQTDLVGILGDKTNVSKVLNRKRPLTIDMIRKFSKAFHISADLLIQEYELAC
jgi:HTH-type transcriptional regulator / antitoxin HigA